MDIKLGGVAYHREAELDGGVVRSTMSVRDYLPEITPAQAKEVNAKLPTFNNKISRVYEDTAGPAERPLAEMEKAAGQDIQKLTAVGSAYYLKGQWADADRLYAKVLAAQPGNFPVRMYRVASLENLGRYDDALKALDGGKFDGANALMAQYSRAGLLLHAKRKDEGIAIVDGLVRDKPGDKDVLFGVGQVMVEGRPERAVAAFTDFLKQDPDNIYGLQFRAQALQRLGREEEAFRDLDAAVRLAPENGFLFMQRGIVLAKLGRNQEALADVEEAWRINPMNGVAAETNAELLRKVGRTKEAPAVFDAFVARDRTGVALNGRCWARALGNVDLAAAEADCAKAVELGPKIGGIWDSYALIAVRQGKMDEAIKRYDKALELAPKQATSLYGRGYAKIKLGDKAGGEADLAAAKAISDKAGQELIEAGLTVN